VHPRADARHITLNDVREIAAELALLRDRVEYNIEGDPRPDLMQLVTALAPHQCTLVPVREGEITSEAGWPADTPSEHLRRTIEQLRAVGTRVSLFVDAGEAPIRWAASLGADRVELYTEPYARACEHGPERAHASLARYRDAALLAHELGMGVNAGHDLDLDNLALFASLPHLDEVSIGHAIVSRALWVGLERVVGEYLDLLAGRAGDGVR
jgi:pyridoxine 5-phosphate synthase